MLGLLEPPLSAHCFSCCTVKPENVLLFSYSADSDTCGSAAVLKSAAHHASERRTLSKLASSPSSALHGYLVKIADFGSALISSGSPGVPKGLTAHGSTLYAAPEVAFLSNLKKMPAETVAALWPDADATEQARREGYDATKADTWSFGVTLFLMVAGHLPFPTASVSNPEFRSFVVQQQGHTLQAKPQLAFLGATSTVWEHDVAWAASSPDSSTWSWPASFPPSLRHLLLRCLRVNPRERWSMGQVLQHQWFIDPSWDPELRPPAFGHQSAVRESSSHSSLYPSGPSAASGGGTTAHTQRSSITASPSATASVWSGASGHLVAPTAVQCSTLHGHGGSGDMPRRLSHTSDKLSRAGSLSSKGSFNSGLSSQPSVGGFGASEGAPSAFGTVRAAAQHQRLSPQASSPTSTPFSPLPIPEDEERP